MQRLYVTVSSNAAVRARFFTKDDARASYAKHYIKVDGKHRSRHNSEGNLIADTDESIVAFWKWFGDSLTTDARHRPIVYHHGSNAHAYVKGRIDVFNTRPESGRGAAFFSSEKKLAAQYGEKIYSTYLRTVRPFILLGNGQHWSTLSPDTQWVGEVTKELQAAQVKDRKSRDSDRDLLQDLFGDDEFNLLSAADEMTLADIPGLRGYTEVETDKLVKTVRSLGYDAVIFRSIQDSPVHDRRMYKPVLSDVVAVFSPKQIKSITSQAFDSDSSSIWD